MLPLSMISVNAVIFAETRTGVDEYESMDVDAGSGGTGPQRCKQKSLICISVMISVVGYSYS